MAMAQKRRNKQAKSYQLTEEDIKWQIGIGRENGFNNRWDLIDPMDKVKFVTFKYGNKKFIANSRTQDIKETADNGEYSMDLRLRPGDVIMYGESNWFCTHGESRIVDMVALQQSGKQQPFHYERHAIKGPVYQQDLRKKVVSSSHHRGISSHESGSQFCASGQEEIKMECKEFDADVVECDDPDGYFISREIKKENGKEWGYLNSPLRVGDVIFGPDGSADKWIVSKRWILRRTYFDYEVIRDDIKIECGQVFDVGDNVHYACHHGKRYALISKYFCAKTIKMRIKARNKQKANLNKKKKKDELLSLE